MGKQKKSVVLAGAVAGVLGLTGLTDHLAFGQTVTWTGAVSNTFGAAGNWNGGAPNSTELALFPSTTTAAIPYGPYYDGADSVAGFQIYNNTGTGGLVWQLPRDGSSNPRTINIGSLGINLTGGGSTSWGAVNTTLAANQTWFIDANTTLAFVTGDNISGSVNLDKTGTGTVILPNASETGFTGNVTIDGGVLVNNRSSDGTGTGSITIDNAGTYLVAGANAQVPGGYLLNSGGAIESTGGTSNSGSYAGLGSGGVLTVNNGSGGTVYLGTLLSTDYFTMYPAIVGGDGTGTIAVVGTGIVQPIAQYVGTNSYNGAWNVNSGGTLRAYTVDSLGDHSTTGSATIDNGANPIYLGNGSVDFAGTSLTSAYPAFNDPVTMIGNGTIAVDEDSPNSVYAYYQHPSRAIGNLTIGNNTLNVTYTANVTGVGTAGFPVSIGVPTLDITAATPTINTLEPSTIATELLVGTITQGVAGVGFIKTGPGDVSISGSNPTFNGPITLQGGFIKVDAVGASNALGTSTITMSPGTQVYFNDGGPSYTSNFNPAGTGTVASDGTLTLAGDTITPGTSSAAGIITLSGKTTLAKNGATPVSLDIGVFGTNGVAGTDFAQLSATQGSSTALAGLSNVNLVLSIAPGLTGTFPTMAIISDSGVTSNSAFANLTPGVNYTSIPGYTYSYTDVSGAVDLTVTATPEPASAVLMLAGVSYLGSRRRNRRYTNG